MGFVSTINPPLDPEGSGLLGPLPNDSPQLWPSLSYCRRSMVLGQTLYKRCPPVFFCRKKLLGFLVLGLVLAKGRGFFYQMIWTTRPHFAKSHSLSLPYVPRSPCTCTPYTRQRAWGTGWGEERAHGHSTFPDVAWLKRRVAWPAKVSMGYVTRAKCVCQIQSTKTTSNKTI